MAPFPVRQALRFQYLPFHHLLSAANTVQTRQRQQFDTQPPSLPHRHVQVVDTHLDYNGSATVRWKGVSE